MICNIIREITRNQADLLSEPPIILFPQSSCQEVDSFKKLNSIPALSFRNLKIFLHVWLSNLYSVPCQCIWPVSCSRSRFLTCLMYVVKVSGQLNVQGQDIWPVFCSRSRYLICLMFQIKVSDLSSVPINWKMLTQLRPETETDDYIFSRFSPLYNVCKSKEYLYFRGWLSLTGWEERHSS